MIDAIPGLADMTPAWLTAQLHNNGYDAKVMSVESHAIGTGQVGATYRLKLTYDGPANGAPPTLVAKLPSNDPVSKAAGRSYMTYMRESRFYALFAGKKPMAIPNHLFIAFDDDSHDFALLMHDLPSHAPGNQLLVPTRAEAELAMDAAAGIHAAWWGDPSLDTLDWLSGTKAVPPQIDSETLYAMLWPAFCDRYGDRITKEIKIVGERYLGNIQRWLDSRSGPRCLTHNDFRPDNMLYCADDEDKPIVIVDWQTVGVGEGASDIAYYLGTSMDPATRKAEEHSLLARYRTELDRHNIPFADLAHQWDAYRLASFSGMLMGVTASMVVEQTDRGDAMFLAMSERSALMAIDHAEIALDF
mgnify:FL=1